MTGQRESAADCSWHGIRTTEAVENGYVFNTVYYDDAITFAYDGRTKDLYGTGDNSVLKIASAEYEEPKGTAPVIEGVENGGNYYATQR